ncbi:MAG: hypothetical protein NT151_12320 [Acidobacteria bacterium]|nr:hypothetical protein [Acidobacteriota bacterium]
MDALYQTPLLDCVRRGEVATDIRLLAAQGILAPRALEQLALLAWLVHDTDPAIRVAAETTLGRIPPSVLARFLANQDVPDDLREFFARRGIVPEGSGTDASEPELFAAEDQGDDDEKPAPDEPAKGAPDGDERRLSTVQRLSGMTITQRVKAAMRGNREDRALLIRDPNKLVSIAVLASPRLTEQEVENYARMASISEDVLRVIGTTRAWAKNYAVVRALTFNPKTPIAISMGMVNRLIEKDVKALASDRNIAEPVKLLARKMMHAGESRKR